MEHCTLNTSQSTISSWGGALLRALISFVLVFTQSLTAEAAINFQDDIFHDIESEGIFIDIDGSGASNTNIQFGNDVTPGQNGVLEWNVTNDEFQFTNGDGGTERANVSLEIETVSALPGGAPGLGAAGEGRLVILDTSDNTAPGCTISPFCAAGTYIWDGGAWISLVGQTASNLTKVVTVNPGGGEDYLTIEDAANYLQTRSGGFMLLSAGTHTVTTDFDVDNVIMIGKDASRTTVEFSGSGQMNTFDTTFRKLTIDVNAITDDMALDVQAGSSSLEFESVDFDVLDSGDSLIDSNEGVAPTLIVKFNRTTTAGGSGDILKSIAGGNLNGSSTIFVDGRSGDTPLEVNDWDVILTGDGAVNTTGTIFPIPADSIFVTPEMNLQGAIDSLEAAGNGGTITLAPGTHTITQTLTIEDDDINLTGLGDASTISTSGTFVSTGSTIGAIQVGSVGTPIDGVELSRFRLFVNDNIHGIRVTGGADNRVINVTVRKVTGTSGSGDAGADIGILMIDGTGQDLVRPVVSSCRIFGNGGSNYFTDGIHVTSDGTAGGVFGNGNNVTNALIEGNNVDFISETAYAIVGADDASLFNNRASGMGQGGGGAFGIFISNAERLNMSANVFTGSSSATATGIGIESFNLGSLKSVTDSVITSNVIDGFGSSGVGFATAFQIGNATNTEVSRNFFQNNIVGGAVPGASVAFDVRGNADNNSISNNSIDGGTNPWDTGINLQAAAQEGNVLRGNVYGNVTIQVSDVGTATLFGVNNHRAAADPTVGDDIDDGYGIGTLWTNTATDTAFILQDNTAGAAVWDQIDGAAGATTLDEAYNNGNTITVDSGGGELLFNLTQFTDFVIETNGTESARFDNGDLELSNNFYVGADAETIDTDGGAFSLDGDDVFVLGDVGVEGQIYSDATATKRFFLELDGAVETSVATGSKISSLVPVKRLDPTADSALRWTFPVPDDYVSGDINVTVSWSPSNTNGGNVQWEFGYASLPDADTITGGDFTLLTPTEAANGTTNQIQQETFAIPAGVIAADEVVFIILNRDGAAGADTFTGNVDIHEVRVEYTGKKIL